MLMSDIVREKIEYVLVIIMNVLNGKRQYTNKTCIHELDNEIT
jgi:hypothetical protein